MSKSTIVFTVTALALILSGCGQQAKEKKLASFIDSHVKQLEPLQDKYAQLYWDAATTGKDEKYKELSSVDLQIRRLYQNPEEYTFLKSLKKSGQIKDPRLSRQLDKLYYAYLQNQIDPNLMEKMVAQDSKIQNIYNNYRGKIEGKEVTTSDIYTIMTTEKDSRKRELAWRASKEVGNVICGDLIELVKLRNQAALQVGFDSYHTLSVTASEQKVEDIDKIFAELDKLTTEPFRKLKAELDDILAKNYGISTSELMPWHYHDPFFQRAPLVYELNLDDYYNKIDVKELIQKYYAGVGLPIEDILAVSDLYDRPGKYPHAFSHSMDRRGHVRVLCNLQNTERWVETFQHELGHALYSKYHDLNEPYLLREPAHSFTTEAAATFFGRNSLNSNWMKAMLNLSDEERDNIERSARKYRQFQATLFSRWALVMYNFEKQLYANPDQDLNNLWWQLVEKYQFVKRPPGPADCGWASKLHFVTAPCYYHNYLLGELLASQWHNYIVHNVLKLQSDEKVSYVGDQRIGKYFRKYVFEPGALYPWNDMIKRSTGEYLTPKYFVNQLIK